MTDQPGSEHVITPGGPRRSDQVHEVPPGQTVVRQAGGEFIVEPRGHVLTAEVKAKVASGEYVITPGGPRRRELVHVVGAGEAVDVRDGMFRTVDQAGAVTEISIPEIPASELPALGTGWITFGAWTSSGSPVITSFTTTWVVPAAPSIDDGQLIYLFNGLQDNPVTHILQPVLQWGSSPDGGGSYWSVASWFVDSSGNAFKTALTNVNEGDTLTGLMTLTSQSGGSFNYRCEFVGLSGTVLNVTSVNQLVMAVETLECYGIQSCLDYPHTWLTAMGSIAIDSASGPMAPSFTPNDSVTDCGQHTVVVSNASPGGEVDLWYTTLLNVSPLTAVTDLARFPTHIDLFVVGTDGSVNSTFWDQNGGWFLRWFRLGDSNFGDDFTVPPESEASCLSRYSNHIDLFASGRDGAIYSTFWDGNGGWFGRWFRLGDPNFGDDFTVPPGSAVSSMSRFETHIDLFVVGRDGGIYSTFWDGSSGWYGHWFRLGDPNFGDDFTVPPGASVTSLSRFETHIDLFVVGRDGGVYSTFWDGSSGWYGHWFRLGDPNFGDDFTVPPGASVTSLSRFETHIDLFVVGRDGGVYSTFWDGSSGWYGHWFRLGDPNFGDDFTVPPGSAVSSMSRFETHIDLFVVGRDGGVYSTFWDGSSGWYGHWFRLGDPNFGDDFTVPPGSAVSSMSRFETHIDLFVVGRDGGVYSTFWDGSSGWYGHWFRL